MFLPNAALETQHPFEVSCYGRSGCQPTPCVCLLQAGSGHRVSAVQSISVWLMGLISGGMAIASVVVNDYFDLKIDATNAPDKPLPSGAGWSFGGRNS